MDDKRDIERVFIQTVLALFVLAAFALNVVYVVSIRPFNDRLNTTDILQISKTILVLLTLILYIPLTVVVTNDVTDGTVILCLLKDFMEKLLFDVYPMTVLAVAITRLRVCFCVGNANVLITKLSGLLTFAASFLLPLLFSLILVLLYNESTGKHVENEVFYGCTLASTTSIMRIYIFATFLITSVIPLVVCLLIYALIYKRVIVSQTQEPAPIASRPRSSVFHISRYRRYRTVSVWRQKQDADVKLSIVLLMVVFTLSSLTMIFLRTMREMRPSKTLTFFVTLAQILVFLFHPIGEGLFLSHKRHNLQIVIRNMTHWFNRPRRKVEPDETSDIDILPATSMGEGQQTITEEPHACKSEIVDEISQNNDDVFDEESFRSRLDRYDHPQICLWPDSDTRGNRRRSCRRLYSCGSKASWDTSSKCFSSTSTDFSTEFSTLTNNVMPGKNGILLSPNMVPSVSSKDTLNGSLDQVSMSPGKFSDGEQLSPISPMSRRETLHPTNTICRCTRLSMYDPIMQMRSVIPKTRSFEKNVSSSGGMYGISQSHMQKRQNRAASLGHVSYMPRPSRVCRCCNAIEKYEPPISAKAATGVRFKFPSIEHDSDSESEDSCYQPPIQSKRKRYSSTLIALKHHF